MLYAEEGMKMILAKALRGRMYVAKVHACVLVESTTSSTHTQWPRALAPGDQQRLQGTFVRARLSARLVAEKVLQTLL